jgi:hypothetical protein
VPRTFELVFPGASKADAGRYELLISHAYATGRLAVVDRSVVVKHPYTERGYKESIAQAQMDEFLGQLTLNELVQYTLLRSHVNRLEPKILES